MSQLNIVKFPKFEELNGSLSVYECGKDIPFEVRRIFTVKAKSGSFRGDHAHKKCTQLLVCVSGKILVTCDDGKKISEHLLEGMEDGLLVPPGTWASQNYLMNESLLMVLCDRVYENDDYIRDYSEFKKYIEVGNN
jgi:dTDP-4-dehydrorhamnose 3,5-epimerase-like enzyme